MKKLLCKDEVSGKIYLKEVFDWNEPVLGPGMYPVNWNERYWKQTTVDNWDYNYETVAETVSNGTVEGNGKGKWANAKTKDGSIYVWIPRYSYKIVSGYRKAVKSWNSDLVNGAECELGKIEVKFSNGVKDDTSDGFILCPAFTFGEDELTGFWVAKFTASRIDATREDEGKRNTVSSRPNVLTWRNIDIGDAFSYSYELNRELDSHLIKNTEWEAVAYLTNAVGRIPYINNDANFLTGMAGETQDSAWGEESYLWNTEKGVKASTTHNVYGVYDMSGGTREYVAGYYGSPIVRDYYGRPVRDADTLINAERKYKDVYDDKNYEDGVFETSITSEYGSSWDKDLLSIGDKREPFFTRSGSFADIYDAGIFFNCSFDGSPHFCNGFRIVFSIKKK